MFSSVVKNQDPRLWEPKGLFWNLLVKPSHLTDEKLTSDTPETRPPVNSRTGAELGLLAPSPCTGPILAGGGMRDPALSSSPVQGGS